MSRFFDTLAKADQKAYRSGPGLGLKGLDGLMPLHLWVGPTGHILRAGPTLQKLQPAVPLQGQRLLEVFQFRRPRLLQDMAAITALDGKNLKLRFRGAPGTALKGHLVKLNRQQGVLLNLSLGIGLADSVRRFRLKTKDFAASDLSVEMLYLIESQAAVLGETRNLTNRLQGAKIAAEEQAFTDTLTGLKNRRALDHVMGRLIARKTKQGFGLMHLDLDFFKAVNDTHGHAAGDHVLQQAARIFVEETRKSDIVARIGGDEFVLILQHCDDIDRLKTVARRIIARLEEPIAFAGATCRVSASIGITLSRFYPDISAEVLAQDADSALYASKNRGRACHTVFEHPLL